MSAITHTVLLDAAPVSVWHLLRQFGLADTWHPQITSCVIEDGDASDDGGSIRTLRLASGDLIHERLLSIDNDQMTMTYGLTGTEIPLDDYAATLSVKPAANGEQTTLQWGVSFHAADEDVARHYEALIGEFILDGLSGMAGSLGAAMKARDERQ